MWLNNGDTRPLTPKGMHIHYYYYHDRSHSASALLASLSHWCCPAQVKVHVHVCWGGGGSEVG